MKTGFHRSVYDLFLDLKNRLLTTRSVSVSSLLRTDMPHDRFDRHPGNSDEDSSRSSLPVLPRDSITVHSRRSSSASGLDDGSTQPEAMKQFASMVSRHKSLSTMKTTNYRISKGASRVPNTETQDTQFLPGLSSLIKPNPTKRQRDKFPPYTQVILEPMIDLLNGAQDLAKATKVSCDCGTDNQTDLVRPNPEPLNYTTNQRRSDA